MAISADQTPSNGLWHTSVAIPDVPAGTTDTATTGRTDTAVYRFGALLDACIYQVYIIEKHGGKLFYDNRPASMRSDSHHRCITSQRSKPERRYEKDDSPGR